MFCYRGHFVDTNARLSVRRRIKIDPFTTSAFGSPGSISARLTDGFATHAAAFRIGHPIVIMTGEDVLAHTQQGHF